MNPVRDIDWQFKTEALHISMIHIIDYALAEDTIRRRMADLKSPEDSDILSTNVESEAVFNKQIIIQGS